MGVLLATQAPGSFRKKKSSAVTRRQRPDRSAGFGASSATGSASPRSFTRPAHFPLGLGGTESDDGFGFVRASQRIRSWWLALYGRDFRRLGRASGIRKRGSAGRRRRRPAKARQTV